MSQAAPSAPLDVSEEISSLVELLHETEQRLEQLTAGEVDAVGSRDGRTLLLRRPQDLLRASEALRQAAILNALPARIALLDTEGQIVSVNRAWEAFAGGNALQGSAYGIGYNYLDVCDRVQGEEVSAAHTVVNGIRAVLGGREKDFSIEYSCHSPTERRWFLMMVTPLDADRRGGAVVMHVDLTAQKLVELCLRTSESRFRQVADNIRDVFFLREADSNRMLYVSPAYARIWGRSCESLYADPESWIDAIHPEDRASSSESTAQESRAAQFDLEYRIVLPDRSIRWIESRGFPVRDETGKLVQIAGIAKDITDRKLAGLQLRESERRFSDMLGSIQLASIMLDREARITYCNDYFLRLTGWQRHEVIGQNWFELFLPPQSASLQDAFAARLTNPPETWHPENDLLTRSGERRRMRWYISVLRSGVGDVIGTASIGEDITERKRAEIRIKHLSRVQAVQTGIASLIVRACDREELFRDSCRIAVEDAGFAMAAIAILDRSSGLIVTVASAGRCGDLPEAFEGPSSIDSVRQTLIARAVEGKKPVVSNNLQHDAGLELNGTDTKSGICSTAVLPLIVADEAVGVIALYAGDIDFFHAGEMNLLAELAGDIAFALDHIDKGERLNYLANYDSTTGLANRALFYARLEQGLMHAAEQHRKLTLVLLDVERFRSINDTLGRDAGDALLKELATRLLLHEVDAGRLARIDADRFAIMISDLQTEDGLAHRIEQRVVDIFGRSYRIGDVELRISARFGIAIFPDDGADAETLFRNAGAALKNAETSGERYVFYTQKMNERVAEKLSLENELRRAVDQGEFVLHYQPKIDLESRKLTGAEALIRWNHPRDGLVPPGRFIPLLEETGLISEVGHWVLRKAIADYLRWHALGLAVVRIAVNVSPRQLRNRAFVGEVREAIGIDARAAAGLELEITESLIMEDVPHSIASLRMLRGMGVSIAIDDFGTGFSSLSWLAKLPVDTLKIDRSFVTEMTTEPTGLALVSTIISLAHALKLKVVAEGVETEEQSRALRLLSCDEMQGYLFSKPVPAQAFETGYLGERLQPDDCQRM
jgi:diguanylate cyclase (GGDEF)-like protein/PAS domain S-box-containing protein